MPSFRSFIDNGRCYLILSHHKEELKLSLHKVVWCFTLESFSLDIGNVKDEGAAFMCGGTSCSLVFDIKELGSEGVKVGVRSLKRLLTSSEEEIERRFAGLEVEDCDAVVLD